MGKKKASDRKNSKTRNNSNILKKTGASLSGFLVDTTIGTPIVVTGLLIRTWGFCIHKSLEYMREGYQYVLSEDSEDEKIASLNGSMGIGARGPKIYIRK